MSLTATRASTVAILTALLACTALGADTAAVSISGGSTSPCDYTHGWRFQALSDIAVTALGTWDEGGDGLPAPVHVGIWEDGGGLLGSVTVAVDDPLTDGFRYADDVLSVSLTSGSYYRIGSCTESGGSTDLIDRWGVTIDAASDIAFDSACYNTTSFSLTYPNTVVDGWQGYFGSNFQYVPIPEPASLVALAAGAGLLLRRRRRA